MLNTPLTRLFGISIPIIGAPMAGVSDAKLVIAISTSGALSGHLELEVLRPSTGYPNR